MTEPNIIAIDGPAASGKSTLAIHLARWLDYLYFDTGIMYRAVTLAGLKSGMDLNNESEITGLSERIRIDVKPPSPGLGRTYDVTLDGVDVTDEIRTAEVDAWVSPVSAYAGVRRAMTAQQRLIGARGKVVIPWRSVPAAGTRNCWMPEGNRIMSRSRHRCAGGMKSIRIAPLPRLSRRMTPGSSIPIISPSNRFTKRSRH
jgi:cytidylate kinase